MLGLYVISVFSIDLALPPMNFGLKYFDPQYYPAQSCLASRSTLYRDEVKSHKKPKSS
ncbi:hypothetical protein [Helicobacter canis]|uniref:hypothetical protein n=1 Tax=Helicobacter canis TaxID=29419 RepID=UPI0026EF013B|nr:hypothetical protein [Helicobacter canis]